VLNRILSILFGASIVIWYFTTINRSTNKYEEYRKKLCISLAYKKAPLLLCQLFFIIAIVLAADGLGRTLLSFIMLMANVISAYVVWKTIYPLEKGNALSSLGTDTIENLRTSLSINEDSENKIDDSVELEKEKGMLLGIFKEIIVNTPAVIDSDNDVMAIGKSVIASGTRNQFSPFWIDTEKYAMKKTFKETCVIA